MSKWESLEGNLATPSGFRAAAIAAGIKKTPGALDLALIVSDARTTSAAGLFTTNRVVAAPVIVSRRNLTESGGRARAILVNAGNANACTGRAGIRAAQETTRATAKLLGLRPSQVLVASTGVIGVPLKHDLILRQLPALQQSLSTDRAGAVADAIMTTDTFAKSCVLRGMIRGTPLHIAGIAKGAGMIHPRMATMLCFITTDADIDPPPLQKLLRSAVDVSFNRITVDGDTSTNDTVLVLASGMSGAKIQASKESGAMFQAGLTEVCQTLARMIARDGEGATKLVKIEVTRAQSAADADRIARAIANSPLVKTAIAGSDPNWGRIICAAGYSGAEFDPGRVDIFINDFVMVRRGLDAGFDEAGASRELDKKELTIRVDLHEGKASAYIWTCDLTHDYITINASYRT